VSGAFNKSYRLLAKADFDRVFKSGRKNHGKYFLVVYGPNNQDTPRLGIAVSRKVSPRAVVRNRIKRQIREAFRQNKSLVSGFDIVVIAKAPSASADNTILHSSLTEHWRKLANDA
jgi:ribonuclease P protein component